MRIVCQKCSAAYSIDDKHVTAKGVRAQCPRCRNLQLVKKDDAPAPPGPTAAPGALPPPPVPPQASDGPFRFDLGGSTNAPTPAKGSPAAPPPPPPAPFSFDFGPPPPVSSESGLKAFDFGGIPPPPPAAAPESGGRGFDFSNLGPPPPPPPSAPGGFDFGGLQPRPASAAMAALESSPSTIARGKAPAYPQPAAPPPEPTASSPSGVLGSPFDFGAPPMSSSPSSVMTGEVKCRTCGKVLNDPFDQALGTCDECRNKETSDPSLDFKEAPRIERTGVPAPSSRPSGLSSAPRPPPPVHPDLVAEMKSVKSAARGGGGNNLVRTGAAIVVLALLVGLGVYIVLRRPVSRRPPPLVVKQTTQAPRPVEGIVQQWRLNYPELEGESAKGSKAYTEQGEELLRKDTTRAYLAAEEAFQKALVLEPGSERALAGWVLALAFGRGGAIDAQTAHAAESMLASSEQRSGDPHVFVAHAHLMIARGGNQNDIRAMADRGKNSGSPADRALAALALGQTLLTKSPQLADQSFKEALNLDPKLKRGYFFQAQLAATQGKYKDAIDALERRLQLDRDQWEAAEELARLYLDVGEPARAKKVLEAARAAAPRAGRPRLDLAMLAYQHLGDPGAALEQLAALVEDAEVPRTERADAYVHLAVLHRLAGDLPRASDAVEKALEATPESAPARLQKFLVLVEKGVVSAARLELEALKDRLNDKQLEATLEGRLLLAENHLDEAFKVLSGVAEADPRRVDAMLLAGAVAARARKDGKAWEYCLKRGLRADPYSRPVASLTHLYVRPADLLRPAVGAFTALSAGVDEDPNPALCEGLVAWYSDEPAQAEKHFARVTAIDPKNADAYAYRALVALGRKDGAGAARQAGRAVDSSRANALAFLAQGQVNMLNGRVDAARASATSALKYNPALLAGKVLQAEAAGRLKDLEEARRILTTVLLTDPQYREAKRVLYKLAL